MKAGNGSSSNSAVGQAHRVLVVDDHPSIRDAVEYISQREKDMIVCGYARTVAEVLPEIQKKKPTVIVLDISLPDGNGLDVITLIRQPYGDLPILIFSFYDDPFFADRALKAGASGYVVKSDETMLLGEAIRRVAAGGIYVSRTMKDRMRRTFAYRDDTKDIAPLLAKLSDKELAVFDMLCDCKGRAEIAQALHISPKTVDAHKEHIKVKLNLHSCADMAEFCWKWRQGAIPPFRNTTNS